MKTKRCEGCGKQRYPTMRRAIHVALVCSRLRGTPLRVYPCPRASGYHLTRQSERVAA